MQAASGIGQPSAEHRFLSVLFCDMVDSTAHQFRMEPEAFAELLSAYRRAVFDVVRRHGGHVARVVGDGILALFGWPRAGGRDAHAAVAAGLEVARRVARLEATTPVAARISIETGWVLVGDIGTVGAGIDDLEHDGVVGPAPHIAAKLQRFARPNGVIVGEGTLPLLGGVFITAPADTAGLELPRPVLAAHVLAEAGSGDLLVRLRSHGAGTMFGRDRERAGLRARWQQARQGEGQVVLLSGEPGIGKSRLIADLLADIQHETVSVLAIFGKPDGTDSPFRPLEEPLRSAMGLSQDAEAQEIRARAGELAASIGLTEDLAATALAFVLGVSAEQMPAATELRRLIFETLLAWIAQLAAQGPTVLVAEDIHWADASTLEFLRQLAERIETMGVLLVASHRSDFMPSWPMRPQLLQLTLGPLVGAAAARLAEDVAGDLPPHLRQSILERAEGVPLFIEEFARAVTSQGMLTPRLPGSLSQLLTARLDGIGSARSLAQMAAVVGREVSVRSLAALAGLEPDVFASAVEVLVQSGVMMHVGTGADAALTFRHALLGDVAYQALPSDRRRTLHQRVVEVFSADASIRPEVLGHHQAAAGNPHAASEMFCQAADNALVSGAFVEAASHANRALEFAESLPEGIRDRAVLAALGSLGSARIATSGYGNSEVQATFERAARLALASGTAGDLLPALRGLISYYQVHGPLSRARELCEKLLQLARLDGNPLMIAEAERRLGWCRFCQGGLVEARLLFDAALERLDTADTGPPGFDHDTTATLTLAALAWLDWLTEGDAAALARATQVAGRAINARRPIISAYGFGFAAAVHQLAGDADGARTLALHCGEVATARGISYWSAMADMLCGWSAARLGNPTAGRAQLRRGLAGYMATESEILRPYALGLLADAEYVAGDVESALAGECRWRFGVCSDAAAAEVADGLGRAAAGSVGCGAPRGDGTGSHRLGAPLPRAGRSRLARQSPVPRSGVRQSLAAGSRWSLIAVVCVATS
jgi:class 3 adenylate cyclase